MSKNKIILSVVVAIVIAGLVFYAGMKFSQGSNQSQTGPGNFSQRSAQFGSSTQKGSRSFGGMVSGQILSLDANNLTIKSQDGGSRIVFLSASTTVNMMTTGTFKDLVVGGEVSVNGSSNTDNSINAQMIQIRPKI